MAKEALNRSKFLNEVADRAGAHRRDVEHVWEHAVSVIQEAVKRGQDVSITGFGKFKQRVIKARKAGWGTNPFTGEKIKVAARPKSAAPKFLPSKAFKEVVGGSAKLPKPSTNPKALASAGSTPARKPAAKKKAPAKKKKAAKKKAGRRR